MKIDPITRVLSRWVSSMHVAFYRLVDGWSPVNWNTLVLTVRGRKTGREISKPLLYLERDGKLYVVASFGGSDKAPDWYLNLMANPEATVEWTSQKLPPYWRAYGRATAAPIPPASSCS